MSFFKAEDFIFDNYEINLKKIADVANAKLEREGKVLYGTIPKISNGRSPEFDGPFQITDNDHVTHKALLINIEPIEKCKHEKEKIKEQRGLPFYPEFKCECGAKVKPTSFEEVE